MRTSLLVVGLLALLAASPTTTPATVRPSTRPNIYKAPYIGRGDLFISIASSNVYLPHGKPVTFTEYGFLYTPFYKEDGKIQDCKGGFFSVRGKPSHISYRSSDPTVMTIDNADDPPKRRISFLKSGTVKILVDFLDRVPEVEVHAIEIPVGVGDTSADVVRLLGLPDQDKYAAVEWPHASEIDGVLYAPSASQGIISARHWLYKAYPGLTVSIVNDRVFGIGSYRSSDLRGAMDRDDAPKKPAKASGGKVG